MAALEEIVIAQRPLEEIVVDDWTQEDQFIFNMLFPGFHGEEPPVRPATPDCPEPPRLRRTVF